MTLHDKYTWFQVGNDKLAYFWNAPLMSAFAAVMMAVSIHYCKKYLLLTWIQLQHALKESEQGVNIPYMTTMTSGILRTRFASS